MEVQARDKVPSGAHAIRRSGEAQAKIKWGGLHINILELNSSIVI